MALLRLKERSGELSYAWGYVIYEEPPASIEKARSIIEGSGRVITIGDIVTRNFLEYYRSDIAIIDETSRRRKLDSVFQLPVTYTCRNPPGTINLECVDAIRKMLEEGRGVLRIVGEEDLLALPTITLCSSSDYVVYGNWHGFMQVIPCTWFFKRVAFRLLKTYFELVE